MNAFQLLDGYLQFKNKQLALKENNYTPPVGVTFCIYVAPKFNTHGV